MKRGFFISIALLIISVNPHFYAAQTLNLEYAVGHALSNNVELAAVRFTIAEAKSRVEQAGRWSNPELEMEFAPNVNGRERSWRVGLDQKFPLTSRLRIEKEITRTQVKLALSELQDNERKLAYDVRVAFLQLAAAEAQLLLHKQQIATLNSLGAASEQAVKAGEASDLQGALIGLDSMQLESQRMKMEGERQEVLRKLKLLLGMDQESELVLEESLNLPETISSTPLQLGQRPDYRSALARKEGAEQAVKRAQANRWEDASVGLFGGMDRTEDSPLGLKTDHVVGVRFAIPLPLWKNNKGRINESLAAAQRSAKEWEGSSMRIQAEAAAAEEQMKSAFALAQSIKSELLPRAIGLEGKLTALNKEGEAGFADIARARERRLQIESAELMARRDFHLAQARYWSALGITTISKP